MVNKKKKPKSAQHMRISPGKTLFSISHAELARLMVLGSPTLTELLDSYEAYKSFQKRLWVNTTSFKVIPKDYVTGTITYKKQGTK